MTFDHVGYLIFGKLSFFNYIGRLAFPIFAYQISQGYSHTKNLKKYISRLALFAFISQIPFVLFCTVVYKNSNVDVFQAVLTNHFGLNILFTLLLGLFAILLYDSCLKLKGNKIANVMLGVAIGVCLGFIGQFIKVDYGFYGVSIILLFHIFRDYKVWMALSFAVATILKYLEKIYILLVNNISAMTHIILCLCTILPIIFILLYNGKKGRNIKYLLYFFYPVHLLLIYVIYLLIN